MRILVAGGAGFLGSHLSEALIEKGHEVIVVDNIYTGSKRNLENIWNSSSFEFIRHDVTFPLYIEVDGIFNLASPASPIHYQRNPVQTFKTNVHGAINLLGLAKRTGARYLQASTSEIYGDPTITPQNESYWGNTNPIGIRSCYDEGKRAAETLTTDYYRQFQVDVRIARIFNTYGPRMSQHDGRVVSNFICQALRQQDITVYGDGRQSRSFCFFTDLIDGLIRLFFAEGCVEPVNLGNPDEVDIGTIAREIIELTGSESKIVYRDLPKDDPKQRCPDIQRAQTLLDWVPKVDRVTGLTATIDYFRKVLQQVN